MRSPILFYRRLAAANDRTSLRQLVALIYTLGGEVSIRITDRNPTPVAWERRQPTR